MGVVPSQSLYCFAVVVMDTGSPKPSHEMDLMNHQSENGLGIFQCEGHDIFSDTALTLSNGVAVTQAFDTDGDCQTGEVAAVRVGGESRPRRCLRACSSEEIV